MTKTLPFFWRSLPPCSCLRHWLLKQSLTSLSRDKHPHVYSTWIAACLQGDQSTFPKCPAEIWGEEGFYYRWWSFNSNQDFRWGEWTRDNIREPVGFPHYDLWISRIIKIIWVFGLLPTLLKNILQEPERENSRQRDLCLTPQTPWTEPGCYI